MNNNNIIILNMLLTKTIFLKNDNTRNVSGMLWYYYERANKGGKTCLFILVFVVIGHNQHS